MPSICLSMIVKDEEAVIDRCLDSILPFVDQLYIVDTGSSDATEERIIQAAKRHNVHGKLVSRPWVDYAHNRNEALAGARSLIGPDDYIVVMDADDVFRGPGLKDVLQGADGYQATYHLGELEFQRPFLVRAGVSWRYYFPVHELLMRSETDDMLGIAGSQLHVDCNVGGQFQGAEHFKKHVEILERYLKDHPECTRSQFYLAQSYQCAGDDANAVRAYAKRTSMEGYIEERVVSWLRIGEMTNDVGCFLEAAALNPTRAEGLYHAALWCKERGGWPGVAQALLMEACNRVRPEGMFLETSVYKWRMLKTFAEWFNHPQAAKEVVNTPGAEYGSELLALAELATNDTGS